MLLGIYLDDKEPLKLYPAVERIEKKQGSNFSIICTTERMRYYSSNFHWFKENGILPNTTTVVRYSTFLRLDFSGLKVNDTGTYKCNVTDDTNIQEKRFQLIVFGKWFGSFYESTNFCSFRFQRLIFPDEVQSRASLLLFSSHMNLCDSAIFFRRSAFIRVITPDVTAASTYCYQKTKELAPFKSKNT